MSLMLYLSPFQRLMDLELDYRELAILIGDMQPTK